MCYQGSTPLVRTDRFCFEWVLGISGQNATKKILNNRKRAVHRKERPIGNLETEREGEETYHRDWWGRGGEGRSEDVVCVTMEFT